MLRRGANRLPPGEAPDPGFVARLRAFENEAWAELHARHHLQICRYAYGRTGSRDAAEEIAAQVFAEALASIGRYRATDRPILAWLYSIARHVASKHARRAGREPATVPLSEAALSDGPDERLDALVLEEALRALTNDQREVVALRFFAGYSTREIAAVMRKREAAVYSLEVRAIGALRRVLNVDKRKLVAGADKKAGPPGIDRVR